VKKYKFVPAVLSLLLGAFFVSGCLSPFDEPKPAAGSGYGFLLVSLAGDNVKPSLGGERTMLPQNPEFTRYELVFFTDATGNTPSGQEPYSFTNSSIQLQLDEGTYYIVATGYNGDIPVAKSDAETVTVTDGELITRDFKLKPYMESGDPGDPDKPVINGVLSYSLSWDGLSRMPARAELTIEYYRDADGDPDTDPVWENLPPSFIPEDLTQSGHGTILLLLRSSALVKLAGSLSLPPGAYRLTISVAMDEDVQAVSRTDAAHVYSNLTTPAVFHYGGGDLLLSNTSPDSGAAFITGFTFTETSNATTVIGSEPGTDGTRLIMIMVPDQVNLANLTPQVTCAPGSSIISPLPAVLVPDLSTDLSQPRYTRGEINFTNPTIWTAQAKDGATQRYTVVVSKAPDTSTEKRITYFFFQNYAGSPGIIDEDAHSIHVILPVGTAINSLTPMISILGKSVYRWDGSNDVPIDSFDFSSATAEGTPVVYRVYAGDASFRDYDVTVEVALDTDKVITRFAIDGYPDVIAVIDDDADDGGSGEEGSITAVLPYGVSLTNLTPVINYKGKNLDPASGTVQNFSAPVHYTVTAQNGGTKTYKVTITNAPVDTDMGIFDFVITNYPNCKVVIGQKPRQDGKIPIVIQVPYGTNETNLIPAITLRRNTSIIDPSSGIPIPFGNESNNQEAIYTVTSQGGTTQKYVAVVSQDVEYYYVNGTTGSDTWPDFYNGGSESYPFKTLAKAVSEAAEHPTIDHIFVSGELNAASEADSNKADSDLNTDSGSVITISGTGGKKITVTGMGSDATLRGTSGKRVLYITDGSKLVFENITVTGGDSPPVTSRGGNGGGIYIGGNSTVKFSGGSITGNTAVSGGGVYIEDSDPAADSEFTLMGGTISGNTATGNSIDLDTMAGGGGVYVKGNALFWLVGGTVSNNTASRGAGGGVLVNGNPSHDPDGPGGGDPHEDGFLMSGGTISGNQSPAGTYPHGGGGVYVAQGAFEMLGGSITGNSSNRQGGGVFVHWGSARFTASGDSLIAGNDGVGSSKAICNRGITEMMGNAQADKVYVWNYDDDAVKDQSFTLGGNARIGGLVLAYSAYNRNYLIIAPSGVSGTDQICRIDLEGHLTGGLFKDFTPDADWLGKKLIEGDAGGDLAVFINSSRIALGSFTGSKTVDLTDHKIVVTGDRGILEHK
jgi:hypothetical protein